MKYTSRADMLIAAGESIKMQEKAGIIPMQKYKGTLYKIIIDDVFCMGSLDQEFPLAVVEGKPVFVGDELYNSLGEKIVARNGVNCNAVFNLSWNKPKPATVMVELLREDAESCINLYSYMKTDRIADACRKALEHIK